MIQALALDLGADMCFPRNGGKRCFCSTADGVQFSSQVLAAVYS